MQYLCNSPGDEEGRALGIGQNALGGVVEAEEGGTVDDDALDGHTEASVQADKTVRLEDLDQAVAQAREFTLSRALARIRSQSTHTIKK